MMRVALLGLLLSMPGLAHAQDRDGDQVADDRDLCPDAAERVAALFPGDGCPDVDTDHDRIVDDYDFCPSVAETVNDFEDADGCPDASAMELAELAERVHFSTGSHALDDTALATVSRLASWLDAHPEVVHVRIIGRADARGDEAANRDLSMRRASAVRLALVARGVDTARLWARGLGALPGQSEETRAQNRRVEVHVSLVGDDRDGVDLSRYSAVYRGDTRMDLDVGRRAREVVATLRPAEDGAELTAYAANIVGDRLVLVLATAEREETLVVRALDASHVVGVIEVRERRTVTRVPWTAWRGPRFDQSAVARMIRAHMAEIQGCYERELREDPTFRGRVAITMTIEETGETTNVRVSEDTMSPPRPALGACVVQIVDAFAFQPGPTGGSVSFTFPFVFEPQR